MYFNTFWFIQIYDNIWLFWHILLPLKFISALMTRSMSLLLPHIIFFSIYLDWKYIILGKCSSHVRTTEFEWERKILILIFRLNLVAHAGWVIKNTIYHINRKWVNIFMSYLTVFFFLRLTSSHFFIATRLIKTSESICFPTTEMASCERFYSWIFLFSVSIVSFNNFIYWSIFYWPKYIFEFSFKVF